jgi:hypothetical protein
MIPGEEGGDGFRFRVNVGFLLIGGLMGVTEESRLPRRLDIKSVSCLEDSLEFELNGREGFT